MAAKDLPLKRRNPNNPQIKSYTEAIRHGRNSYHILPEENGWKVKQIGSPSGELFATKDDAISHAKAFAKKAQSDIFIHGKDGLIQSRDSFTSDSFAPRK